MQTMMQITTQKKPHKFAKGRSGNPSGVTTRQRCAAELTAKFTSIHGRAPDIVEAATIVNIAGMMARLRGKGNSAEDMVRMSNCVDRLAARLGLAPKPASEKKPKPTLADYVRDKYGTAP